MSDILNLVNSLYLLTKQINVKELPTQGYFYPIDFTLSIKRASIDDIFFYNFNFVIDNIDILLLEAKRIIRNNAIDHIRRKKYTYDNIDEIKELVDEKIEVFENLKAKTLINLINKLSPAYKTVFNLYVMEDYTHKEIANILNISPNTSKSNYKKAKAKLLKMYNI